MKVIKELSRNNKGIKKIYGELMFEILSKISFFTLIRGKAVVQMSYEAQKDGAKYPCWWMMEAKFFCPRKEL